MGVVVGETAEIGDGCTIYQGVTLGGTSLAKGAKRHPTLGRDVIVGANSQVLGGFTVGDGARIGSSAVVVKPVPPGATAVGNPARVIQAEAEAAREEAAAKMGFSAYGVTQGDDPVSQAMKGLIDNASGHEHQIALLWQAIEKLSSRARELPADDCVPQDAHTDRDLRRRAPEPARQVAGSAAASWRRARRLRPEGLAHRVVGLQVGAADEVDAIGHGGEDAVHRRCRPRQPLQGLGDRLRLARAG